MLLNLEFLVHLPKIPIQLDSYRCRPIRLQPVKIQHKIKSNKIHNTFMATIEVVLRAVINLIT